MVGQLVRLLKVKERLYSAMIQNRKFEIENTGKLKMCSNACRHCDCGTLKDLQGVEWSKLATVQNYTGTIWYHLPQ